MADEPIIEENAQFDLAWAPPRYPDYSPQDRGNWRLVYGQDDSPVGVVWTNGEDASGVSWVTQTDAVTRLNTYFTSAARAGVKAYPAYYNATHLPRLDLGPEESGLLSAVDEAVQGMMDEVDEARR